MHEQMLLRTELQEIIQKGMHIPVRVEKLQVKETADLAEPKEEKFIKINVRIPEVK